MQQAACSLCTASIDGFQAIDKHTQEGLSGLSAHPMTPEEVAAHRAEFDAIAAEDARTFAERVVCERLSRGEYDGLLLACVVRITGGGGFHG